MELGHVQVPLLFKTSHVFYALALCGIIESKSYVLVFPKMGAPNSFLRVDYLCIPTWLSVSGPPEFRRQAMAPSLPSPSLPGTEGRRNSSDESTDRGFRVVHSVGGLDVDSSSFSHCWIFC